MTGSSMFRGAWKLEPGQGTQGTRLNSRLSAARPGRQKKRSTWHRSPCRHRAFDLTLLLSSFEFVRHFCPLSPTTLLGIQTSVGLHGPPPGVAVVGLHQNFTVHFCLTEDAAVTAICYESCFCSTGTIVSSSCPH